MILTGLATACQQRMHAATCGMDCSDWTDRINNMESSFARCCGIVLCGMSVVQSVYGMFPGRHDLDAWLW